MNSEKILPRYVVPKLRIEAKEKDDLSKLQLIEEIDNDTRRQSHEAMTTKNEYIEFIIL